MSKGFNQTVTYFGGIIRANDEALEALASKCGGSRVGSGCMIGFGSERDIEFRFKTPAGRRKFRDAAKTVSGVNLA